MTELESSIVAYATFLDEQSLARLPDQTAQPGPDEGEVMTVDLQTQEPHTDRAGNEIGRRRWARWALVSAAAAIVVIVAVALFDDADENTQLDVISDPIDDDGAESPTPEQAALSVADAYFAANSAADFDALLALLAPGATFSGPFHIADDEQVFAWNAAQGTELSEPDCTVNGEPSPESVAVRCTAFTLDALVQAVDGPPVPITLTLTVTPEGIGEEAGNFGQPDFNAVGEPFNLWMIRNHPDDADKVGFVEWASVEEAAAGGALRAQYAQEWATYLDANGCGYDDRC